MPNAAQPRIPVSLMSCLLAVRKGVWNLLRLTESLFFRSVAGASRGFQTPFGQLEIEIHDLPDPKRPQHLEDEDAEQQGAMGRGQEYLGVMGVDRQDDEKQ